MGYFIVEPYSYDKQIFTEQSYWFHKKKLGNVKNLEKLKKLLSEDEHVKVIYCKGSKPFLISDLVAIYDSKDYEEKLDEIGEAPEGYEQPTMIRVEEGTYRIHSKIKSFIKSKYKLLKEGVLYEFDEEEYDKYLESKGIEFEYLVESNKVDIDSFSEEVFLEEEGTEKIIRLWNSKKNIILQGPPGVGKTFIARRLAGLHMEFNDPHFVQMVQFHQSYSYEDFVQGYKPNADGGFQLKNGVFYNFCKKAEEDPINNYYFIIDEINRGNLSKIFGELLMLIEADKRGEDYAIPLTYSEGNEKFYIPENVYIIGLMNTADRSLAVVDYALRRRFAFIQMKPNFGEKFVSYLEKEGISLEFISEIVDRIIALNEMIEADPNLGSGFLIGHSYFCSNINVEDIAEEDWYNDIIENEIAPTLEEYWYDDLSIAQDEIDKLYYK